MQNFNPNSNPNFKHIYVPQQNSRQNQNIHINTPTTTPIPTPVPQLNILFYMQSCKTCMVFINTAKQYNILRHFKMVCIDGQTEKYTAQGLKKVPTIIIPSMNKQFEGNDCIRWLEEIKKINSMNNFMQDELVIPDNNFFNSNSQKYVKPQILPIPQNPQMNSNISINNKVSELSNQLNQLASQINNDSSSGKTKNQFEVNKNNTVKRNNLSITQPPLINNTTNMCMNNNMGSNSASSGPSVRPIKQFFGFLQNEMSGFSDGYAYVDMDNPLPKSFLPPDKDMEIYTAPEGDKIDYRKQQEFVKKYEIERNNDQEQFTQTINELTQRITMGDKTITPKWYSSNENL